MDQLDYTNLDTGPDADAGSAADASTDAAGTAVGTDAAGTAVGADAAGTAVGADAAGTAVGTDAAGTAVGADAAGTAVGTDAAGTAVGTDAAGTAVGTDAAGTAVGTDAAASAAADAALALLIAELVPFAGDGTPVDPELAETLETSDDAISLAALAAYPGIEPVTVTTGFVETSHWGHGAAAQMKDAAFGAGAFAVAEDLAALAPLANDVSILDRRFGDDSLPHSWSFAAAGIGTPSALSESAVAGPQPAFVPNDPQFASQWHLQAINVQSVWNDYTGAGIKLGLIDDGVEYTHPDLAANYNTALDYDARGGDNDAFTSSTSDRHGTSVSGTMAAVGNNGVGVTGVAYGAQIVGFRMGFGSAGSVSQITDAFQHAIVADVVNNSWGYSGYFIDNFASATFAATGAALANDAINGRGGLGTIIVFASGNSRTSGDNVDYHSFQDSKYVISVAATDSTNHYTYFSNPGAGLLVSAPGLNVTTTDRVGSLGYSSGDYTTVSGTSFAAPIVSGVAGLMLDANPNLGARDVQEILAYSAKQIDSTSARWSFNGAGNWNGGGLHFSTDYGFGLVDAHAAVRLAETWTAQNTFSNMISGGASRATAQAIPDGNSAGISQTVTLASNVLIDHVEVDLNISHTWIGDLRVVLIAPDGTQSILVDRPGINPDAPSGFGASQDNINFTINSNQFWGETSQGTWTLVVSDNVAGDTGTLNSWAVRVYGDPVPTNDTYIFTDEYAGFTGAANAARRLLTDSDGGRDAINASAVTGSGFLDMVPGHSSTIAGNTLTIAAGTVVEDASMGDGNDTVAGNSADNLILGGRGNDSLDGAAGNDTALYFGAYAGFTVTIVDATHVTVTDFDLTNINEGLDALANFEFIQFSDYLYVLSSGPVNNPPVANNDGATTNEDNAVTVAVLANDTDPNGDTLTVTGAANGAHGTVAVNANNTVTYTPVLNYNGADSFTYSISDGFGGTSIATVNVTVNPVNDNPAASNDAATTNEDNAVTVAVLGNDTDVDGDSLSVTGATNGAHGTVAVNANNTVTYTPTLNYNGPDSFTYTISDGFGGTSSATVNVTVNPVNDNPAASNDAATTNEDNAVTVAVLGNDTDVDGDSLSVTGATNGAHGSVVVNANNTVTYTPVLNYNGPDSFTYTISDGNGGTSSATVNLTVNPVNDNPAASNDSANTTQNTPVTVAVLTNDTDVDGDILSVTGATNGANGTVAVNANNTVTYTPNSGFSGNDSFTYSISDGFGGTSSATVNVAVGAVNSPPLANNDSATTNEDNAVTVAVLGNDTDPNSDALTVTGATNGTHGTVVVNANNTVTYTPVLNYNGPDSFTYTISDGNGGTSGATVNLTVNPVNDPPVANNDAATTNEDNAVIVAVLGNDTDVDGGTLSVTGATNPAHGTVLVNANNTVTYTPVLNYNGPDSFTYTISDGNGGTSSATVNLTVNPVNDNPVANNDSANTTQNTPVTVAVLPNDTDVDGDLLTVTGATNPAHGTVLVNANNTVTYTPTAGYTGADSFTYSISDGFGGTASATVALSVSPPPPGPVTLISENFDAGAGGFAYRDDAFLGTSQPSYESGSWASTGGVTGGGLDLALGGINNANVNGMSGGFDHGFALSNSTDTVLTFTYNLTQSPNYEPNEFSQVLVSVDGVLFGTNGNTYVTQISGNGNGGSSISTGWVTVTIDLGVLAAGDHTLTIGGYNNHKDSRNESTELLIDNVTVATNPGSGILALDATAPQGASATDGADSGGTLKPSDVLETDHDSSVLGTGTAGSAAPAPSTDHPETVFTPSVSDILASLLDAQTVQAACAA